MSFRDEVKVTVDMDEDDIKRVLTGQMKRKYIIIGILMLFCLLVSASFAVAAFLDETGTRSYLGATVFLPAVLLLTGIAASNRKRVRDHAAVLLKDAEPTVYTFLEDALVVVSEAGNTRIKWASIGKAMETKSDFLLVHKNTMTWPIPKRFFESDKDISDVRELLSDVLGKNAKLLKP